MEVITNCCNKVHLARKQPKSYCDSSYIQSPKWRRGEADGQVSNSRKEEDSNYTKHKIMQNWWFSKQVKLDSSMKAKWHSASWSVQTQQEPAIKSQCLSQADHYWYLEHLLSASKTGHSSYIIATPPQVGHKKAGCHHAMSAGWGSRSMWFLPTNT